MDSLFPITLQGDNLGKRHQYLNNLVNIVYCNREPFDSIRNIPEASSVDRIFKIDLASKYRNVEYIIETLKDKDMLFVSRALKCTWLLNSQYHAQFINPTYLESTLFPEMVTTAVNKFMHWLQLNLKDEEMCEEFYNYYYGTQFAIALKFLFNCSQEFIRSQATKYEVLAKLSPKYLNKLCEKCPEIGKAFFDAIENNKVISDNFSSKASQYYNGFKRVLKLDATVFLDIIEQYCESDSMKLGRETTKYIMKNFRNRYEEKPELYTYMFLDIKTVGKCLTHAEITEVLLKLARAEYLSDWFNYKAVEALIKYLPSTDRTFIKKLIFVDKNFGDKIKNWPYKKPSRPLLARREKGIFDELFDFGDMCDLDMSYGDSVEMCCIAYNSSSMPCLKRKTMLDELFDKFRFQNFEGTLFELRKKINLESSAQNREYMLLVLVSKSGGREDNLEKLIQLLSEKFVNEPANLRAAVVRSLVRRAFVWRLPDNLWQLLISFAHDLGLDGKPAVAPCHEGVHAVILRNFLMDIPCNDDICKLLFENVTTYSEYTLNKNERCIVKEKLPELILKTAYKDIEHVPSYFNYLMDTITAYKISSKYYDASITLVLLYCKYDKERDFNAARPMLNRLYNNRIGRKELIREYFSVQQTNQSYLNVLRHDASILKGAEDFKTVIEQHKLKHNSFLRKLSIYFNESGGLASNFFEVVKLEIEKETQENVDAQLARAFVVLTDKKSLLDQLAILDNTPTKSAQRRLAAAIRSNIHLIRPFIDYEVIGFNKLGAKVTANTISICSSKDLDKNIELSLKQRSLCRMALILAIRKGNPASVFTTVSEKRPTVAVNVALRYFKLENDPNLIITIWNIIKPVIEKLDLTTEPRKWLLLKLKKINSIPTIVKADYFVTLYNKILNKSNNIYMKILLFLPSLPENFLTKVTNDYLVTLTNVENTDIDKMKYGYEWRRNVEIMGKYLLLNKTDQIQKDKLETYGEKILMELQKLWRRDPSATIIIIKEFIRSFTYFEVFLDLKYVDAKPVFHKFIAWMQTFLPVEQHFKLYTDVHATLLLYTSVRESVKQNPHIFAKNSNKEKEVAELVGTKYGKYLACETSQFMEKYFPSIRDLFHQQVFSYLQSTLHYGENKQRFYNALVKSFAKESSQRRDILGKHILMELNLERDTLDAIKEQKNSDLNFFLYAIKIYGF